MRDEMKQRMIQAGIGVDRAIERFVDSEELAVQFWIKFLDDPTYQELEKALEKKETEEAFRAAHTLKGVTGNLGMDRLFESKRKIIQRT